MHTGMVRNSTVCLGRKTATKKSTQNGSSKSSQLKAGKEGVHDETEEIMKQKKKIRGPFISQ